MRRVPTTRVVLQEKKHYLSPHTTTKLFTILSLLKYCIINAKKPGSIMHLFCRPLKDSDSGWFQHHLRCIRQAPADASGASRGLMKYPILRFCSSYWPVAQKKWIFISFIIELCRDAQKVPGQIGVTIDTTNALLCFVTHLHWTRNRICTHYTSHYDS